MCSRRICFREDLDGTAIGTNLFIGIAAVVALIVACWRVPAVAQQSTQDLAVAAQNPIAAMYSLPFQNNAYFGAGPNHNEKANVLNIQPVLPFSFGDLNIISRTVAPLISLPGLATDPRISPAIPRLAARISAWATSTRPFSSRRQSPRR